MIVSAAINRAIYAITQQSYVPWKFHSRNADFEPSTSGKKRIRNVNLEQTQQDPPNVFKPLAGEVDESYSLQVTEDGEANIKAASSIGLVRGLTTFSQLFYAHSEGGSYTPYAPVEIKDAPKFAYRGLNMDVSRNFFSVADIKKMIDALAFSKFNRLHLHITDSQSWPLVIPAIPELAAKGAFRKHFVYSPEDVKNIQAYGALQGVSVHLEIDMPGHTSSIWYSHPDLIASFNQQPNWDRYAAEPPSGTLKLNSPGVRTFLDTVFEDLLPRVAPYTAYFHTGGDEVNVNAYINDDTVNSNDTAVLQPLMQKFVEANHDAVRKAGLTPIVWEEMLITWNVTLGADVVVQTWISDEAAAQVVSKGYKAVVGNYNYWVR